MFKRFVMQYRITPIRNDFLMKVRGSKIDDQNQPVVELIAEGGEPCRDVLRRARPGEKLILASYCPFYKAGPYKEYGAIFLLANESDELVDFARLPLTENKETDYLGEVYILRAYNSEESIFDAHIVTAETAEETINEFFEHSAVEFIHARNAAYGCYSFRLDRK